MTNHWIDIKNSDCIIIMGSNAAECHPISFKYVIKAMAIDKQWYAAPSFEDFPLLLFGIGVLVGSFAFAFWALP